MKKMFAVFLTFLYIAVALPGVAQEKHPKTGNTKQQMKRLDKVEKQKKKDQEKAEKEILKAHSKIQSKETRKRMKETKKKSKRLKSGKKQDPFYKRWFRKK